MSIEYMNLVWKSNLEIEPSDKFILLTLANCCDHEGSCFPSIFYLSQMTGYSESTVHRSLNRLTKLEIIKKDNQIRKNGSATSNKYWILIHIEALMAESNTVTMTPPPVTMTPPPCHHDTPYIHHLDPSIETKQKEKLKKEKVSVASAPASENIISTNAKSDPAFLKKTGILVNILETDKILEVTNKTLISILFKALWDSYPKEGRKASNKAMASFLKINPTDGSSEFILERLEAQKNEKALCAKKGVFCASWRHITTWINQRGWEDEILTDEEIERLAREEAQKRGKFYKCERSKVAPELRGR